MINPFDTLVEGGAIFVYKRQPRSRLPHCAEAARISGKVHSAIEAAAAAMPPKAICKAVRDWLFVVSMADTIKIYQKLLNIIRKYSDIDVSTNFI